MFFKWAISAGALFLAPSQTSIARPDVSQSSGPLPAIVKQPEIVYPKHSLRLDEEGLVEASYWIETSGRTSRCSIVTSSGFSRLDEATCKAISKMTFANVSKKPLGPFIVPMRWKFDEPTYGHEDVVGVPADSRGVNRTLAVELRPGQRVNLGLDLNVNSEGAVVRCLVIWGSGNPVLDKRACDTASTWRYYSRNSDSRKTLSTLETFFFADPEARIFAK